VKSGRTLNVEVPGTIELPGYWYLISGDSSLPIPIMKNSSNGCS